ncbi:MAG: hypothetical protein ACRCT1_06055 [Microcoleaceae cyanobacterium]
MARYSFLVAFEQKVTTNGTTTTQKAVTVMSCCQRVAEMLGLENSPRAYQMKLTDTRKRAAHDKMVWKKDPATGAWAQAKITIPETQIVQSFSSNAKSQKITLFLRGKGANKTSRTLTFTAPSTLTVGQIADALGDLIPPSKRGTAADDILPIFSLKGGRQYPIPTKTAADATPQVDVPDTEAETTAKLAAAEPQKPTK